MKLKIDEIIVADNRRRIDEAKVRELAESIQKVGLLNPITVTLEKKLVAGEHRLRACLLLGWTEIECQTIQGDERLQQLAEIDENLVRNDLDPISVGELAIKRDEILETLGLRANKANAFLFPTISNNRLVNARTSEVGTTLATIENTEMTYGNTAC